MTRPLLVALAALTVAVLGLGYFAYSQVQRNGQLSTSLDVANAANKAWQESYATLERQAEERQQRLDAAIERDETNRQFASQQSKLFRTEIDALKRANNELSQLLDSRIPDSLLISLCRKGYAAANVCETVLPASR